MVPFRHLPLPLLVVTSLGACSIGVPDSAALPEGSLPMQPLQIVDPGVVYSLADDEDPDAPGLQVLVRVDVNDEAVDRVELRSEVEDATRSEPVTTDLDGARVAVFVITLAREENPVTASAAALRLETHAVVRAVGAAVAGQ